MSDVKKFTFGTNNWDPDAETLKAYFDSLNCPLITTELLSSYDLLLTIADTLALKFYGYGNPGARVAIIIDGVETDLYSYNGAYGSKTYIVAFNDNFISIDYQGISYSNEHYYFAFEIIDELNYYGFYSGAGNLANVALEEMASGLKYKHGARLNYECQPDTLDYASDILFDNSNIKAKEDTNFVACSIVTAKQVITFESQNYYSLSPNVLMPLDS